MRRGAMINHGLIEERGPQRGPFISIWRKTAKHLPIENSREKTRRTGIADPHRRNSTLTLAKSLARANTEKTNNRPHRRDYSASSIRDDRPARSASQVIAQPCSSRFSISIGVERGHTLGEHWVVRRARRRGASVYFPGRAARRGLNVPRTTILIAGDLKEEEALQLPSSPPSHSRLCGFLSARFHRLFVRFARLFLPSFCSPPRCKIRRILGMTRGSSFPAQ